MIKRAGELRFTAAAVLLCSAVGISLLFYFYLPPAVDWTTAFRPAAWKLIRGQSPYQIEGFFNAPWALIPLLPAALFPEQIGRALGATMAITAYAYTAYQLGAKRMGILILLLSPPVLHSLLNGSIDWMASLGFIMPPQIGLFFVAIKPQVGVGVGLYWLIETWADGGAKRVIKVFGPFTAVLMSTFLVFGLWPLRFERELGLWWNASLWPLSIPIGLGLLTAALKRNEIRFGISSSPFLSPYVLLHSYVGVLLAVVHDLAYLSAGVLGLWMVVILQLLTN